MNESHRHSRISGPHNPKHRRQTKLEKQTDPLRRINQQPDIARPNLQQLNYLETYLPLIGPILRYFNQMTKPQKIACIVFIGAITGLSFYMIIQLMSHASSSGMIAKNYSHNFISDEDRSELTSKKFSHKVTVDPNTIKPIFSSSDISICLNFS